MSALSLERHTSFFQSFWIEESSSLTDDTHNLINSDKNTIVVPIVHSAHDINLHAGEAIHCMAAIDNPRSTTGFSEYWLVSTSKRCKLTL